MTGRDPTVLTAIRNVEGRQSSYDWWALTPRQRTEAIYGELRRLDADKLARGIEGSPRPARRLAYAVA